MHYVVLIILAIINAPLYLTFMNLLFKGDLENFKHSLKALLNPHMLSAFRMREDMMGEFKAFAFLMCCITAVYGQYLLVTEYLY